MSDAGDDCDRVQTDGVIFSPVISDHEKIVSRDARGNLERESAGAIGVHGVCARAGRGPYVAVGT